MKNLFLACWLTTLSAHAAIKVESSGGCNIKPARITQFIISQNNKKLSYRAEGKVYQLAESSTGVLVGRFRALMMGDNLSGFDGKWLDFAEIPLSEIEARNPKTIDQKFYYLPLQRTISAADLGLDSNWKINSFVFDFNRNPKDVNEEKEWQFVAKNIQTGDTNTVMARDVEKRLLEQCHLASK